MISIVAEADLAGGLSATRKQPQISPAKIVGTLVPPQPEPRLHLRPQQGCRGPQRPALPPTDHLR
jgi:hypothetical protein